MSGCKPPPNLLKVNMDVILYEEEGTIGVEVVIRGLEGQFITRKAM